MNANLTVTRRGLVKAGGVVVGLAGAGMLAGQAKADEAAEETPAFLTEVEVDESQVAETVDVDIVVVGMGIAGVAAVRTAAEEGKKVAFMEKCATPQGRSGDFGALNAECTKQYEMTGLDTNEVVAELMKESGYRADYRILKAWADNSGTDLDWYFGAVENLTYLPQTTSTAPDADAWVQPERYPLPELWEGNDDEYYPCYQTTVRMYPSHEPALNANLAKAEETGNVVAEYFQTSAVKLVGDATSGITGVIGQSAETGEYVQVNAKAVILATGDISGNAEMLHYYAPQTDGIITMFPPTAPDGSVPNKGDGQRMGMLAGAVLEEGPYAPMIHHMGACMGSACFLQLNRDGKRFMNEDVPGQQLENQIEAQPGRTTWQFFDGGWRDQVPHFKPEHGAVCYVLEDGAINGGEINDTLTHKDSFAYQEQIDDAVEDGTTLKADTIEELLELIGADNIDIEAAKESIERYNELAKAGNDDDFGKKASRMFALETAPFYASEFGTSTMLVCMCGLQSDYQCHTYDADGNVVPGLYVAGNVMGNRFKVQYPTTVPGISHSVCLSEGRIAARTAIDEQLA